jgi:predicted house-cleaning noncanonical NTP pyrophosphatase (MazG superfamily)
MKIDDRLSDIFDVPKLPEKVGEIIDASTGEIIETSDVKIESDYDKSRNNLHSLLEKGHEALAHALEVAKQSEHPRAFEVVGNLVKQLADVNQQLLDVHQQKQKLDAPKAGDKAKVTNNNAIFVGSTAELTRMIKNMNKGE